ncbi:SDR family oxidoreductase [Leeuwenhoekiella palythoae]|uniref:SDR family oxidoreductase n=1 Tax=Leeuwenhoekiella palythoae TaxID=573501 RepID=UPI0035164FE2
MNLQLKNKIVLVTGSAGMPESIGHTLIFKLADEGAIPILLDRNERGYEYQKQLEEKGIPSNFYQIDLADPNQIEDAINKAVNQYGRIDVVINNVGVNDGISLDHSINDFMYSLKLNLVSFFATVKYALPHLKKSKGNILNVGSKVALTGQGGTSGYAAAKGGVLGLTREWAVDLITYGIRCNALIIAECYTPAYENWIESLENGEEKLEAIKNCIPLESRMTKADEIADTILFTISNRSSHTTGQFLFVDGGYVHLDRAILPFK